jgi:hypothetical protein
MGPDVMGQIAGFLTRHPNLALDITGGCPEMNPNFRYLIEQTEGLVPHRMLRSNLAIMAEQGWEWRREAEKIQTKMLKHHNANDCYLDDGVQLLELMQHAVNTYKVLDSSIKRSFLKIVHSNLIWKDGALIPEYLQPFDFIAKTNIEYAQKMAVSREKNGHCPIWLPSADSNHGHGD